MSEINNPTEEMKQILEKVADALQLKDFECLPDFDVLKGEGFLSEFFTGEIFDNMTKETIAVAVKKEPKLQFWEKYPIAHTNELNFYEKVFPVLDDFQKRKGVKHSFDNIPTYLTGSDIEKGRFVALRNLKPLGFGLYDKTDYFNQKELEFVFKVYGRFHALSFSLQQQEPDKFEKFKECSVSLMQTIADQVDMFQTIVDSYFAAMDFFDPFTESDMLKRLKKIENVKEAYINALTYKGKHKCLIHGDCWSNNMLFKYTEDKLEDMRLLDFQLINVNTPIYDLCYCFYTAASKKDLDKLDYYLDVYYESLLDFSKELGSNAEEFLPKEILKSEWKQYSLFGIIFGIHLWLGKLSNTKELMEKVERDKMNPEECMELFKSTFRKIRAGDAYKERARNLLLHALEYGLL